MHSKHVNLVPFGSRIFQTFHAHLVDKVTRRVSSFHVIGFQTMGMLEADKIESG